jgi:capsular exopolysaccharide synthesis family protein
LLAGLALGSAAALLLELFDRRVRDEAELVALYPLPVLARVPKLPRRVRQKVGQGGWRMPPVVHEAFRTILAQLHSSPKSARSVMVTSASTGDGKTTSAINLAVSIAASGQSVILLDLDLRKPDVGRFLGIEGAHPLSTLLTPNPTGSRFVRLLESTPLVPNLRVLCAAGGAGNAADLAAFESSAAQLLAEAMQHADFVVADTPPLGEVADALRFAHAVDGTILVAWPRKTHLRNFEFARDLLERGGHTPIGYLLVGVPQGASAGYYQSHGRAAAAADCWSSSTSRVRSRTRAASGRREDGPS